MLIDSGNAAQGEHFCTWTDWSRFITAPCRHAAQCAIEPVDPAVIATPHCFDGRTTAFADDLCSLVHATVEEHSNLLVVATDQHDRVSSDARSVVVTGLRNLAFVTDIDPTALEDARELGLEDRSIDVNRAVHGVRPDTGGEVERVFDSFHDLWY